MMLIKPTYLYSKLISRNQSDFAFQSNQFFSEVSCLLKAHAHSALWVKSQLTQKESFNNLNNLKIHKAYGRDCLHARVLKESSSEIAPILAFIYNEWLAQGTVVIKTLIQSNLMTIYLMMV